MAKTDLTTKRFGILTVLQPTERRQRQYVVYECLCDCGVISCVSESNLRSGHTKSCGCLKHKPSVRRVDITNQRFGMLTAIKIVGVNSHGQVLWLCQCDCGNIYIGRAGRLKSLEVKSCGCQEGATTHGLSYTAAYKAHKAMMHRCFNPQYASFKDYGGRGIDICQRWLDVENFVADMGQPPPKLTIERINNHGGYWCGSCEECANKKRVRNCKWDTMTNQNRNHRSNHYITASGRTMTMVEWSIETGFAKSTIMNRLYRGWSEERSVTEPIAVIHRRR